MFGPWASCSTVVHRLPQGQRYFRVIADHGGAQEVVGHLVKVPSTAQARLGLVPGTLCWSWDAPVPAKIRLVQAHPARAPVDSDRVWHSAPVLEHLPSDEGGAPLRLERCSDGRVSGDVVGGGMALRSGVPGVLALPASVLDFPWGGFLRVVDLERAAQQQRPMPTIRKFEAA
jgi:hypothetical protein